VTVAFTAPCTNISSFYYDDDDDDDHHHHHHYYYCGVFLKFLVSYSLPGTAVPTGMRSAFIAVVADVSNVTSPLALYSHGVT